MKKLNQEVKKETRKYKCSTHDVNAYQGESRTFKPSVNIIWKTDFEVELFQKKNQEIVF